MKKFKELIKQETTDIIVSSWKFSCRESGRMVCPVWYWINLMRVYEPSYKVKYFEVATGITRSTLQNHKFIPAPKWNTKHIRTIADYTLIPYEVISGAEI